MTAQQLKNSILQLAVQGKLVPQDPNDEPASILLEKIRNEKQRLVKEGKIKKEKPLPPISEDEIPFDVPESWVWCTVSTLGEIVTGSTPSTANLEYYGDDYPFYKPADLDAGSKVISSRDMLSSKGYDVSRPLKENSVLITCIGATIGKTGVIRKEGACNQQINAIIPMDCLSADFIFYCCSSDFFQKAIKENASSTTLPILNKGKFSDLLFPFPPLAEQHRIVERIEQLLPHIAEYDTAEQKLTALNAKFPDLLKKSILQSAVQGKLVPQDDNDEPASILLERIRAEKEQLIKDGKLKKDKPLPPITKDEIPFDVPESWEWVRLGRIVYNHGQMTPETDFCYIDIGSINNQKQLLNKQETILSAEKAPSRARKIVMIGDILYSTVRP